jgi:hypothetical protein
MRALSLDFQSAAHRPGWTAYAVLVLAAFAAFELVNVHTALRDEADTLRLRVAQFERRGAPVPLAAHAVDEATLGEIAMANAVIGQLALPWERLFRAIEGATVPRVALLGIAPDARAGTVEIVAEATDAEAMFDYLNRLKQQPQLREVYLLTHQHDARNGARPLRFTLTTSWNEPRN